MLAERAGRAAGALWRPERRFWLLVGLIILVGAWLRVLVHDHGLPWFEEIDELRIWFYGREVRGVPLRDVAPENFGGYPPLMLWLHQLAQPWAEAQGRVFAVDAVLDIRRFMLALNILGTLWAAMLGRRCGGALAGVAAAALWAFTRLMLNEPVLAIGESLAAPLLLLTLLLALQGLEPGRRWLPALLSLGTGLLCFLAEFRLIVALFPGAAVLLLRARARYGLEGRRLALWGAALLALAVVASAVVFSLLPERYLSITLEAIGRHLWDLERLELHFDELLRVMNLGGLFVLFLLASSLLPPHRMPEDARRRPALLLTGATLLLILWATSGIRPYGESDPAGLVWARHLLPAAVLFHVLIGAALARIARILQGRARTLFTTGLAAYLLLFQLMPALQFAQEQRLLPWPVLVRHWVDDNLEPGTILVRPENDRWFNPFWGGIPHRKWFDWWVGDILDKPLQEWIETHQITWLMLPLWRSGQLQESAEGRELLAQLLPLNRFAGPPERREREVAFYRLWRMQQESKHPLRPVHTPRRYDVHNESPAPGEAMEFTFYWNAVAPPTENDSLFLHLVAADGTAAPGPG